MNVFFPFIVIEMCKGFKVSLPENIGDPQHVKTFNF